MQELEIFKAGTHTDGGGRTLTFTEADLDRTVAAYDPAVHEAPLVVGHPRHDAPAYGWVGGLARRGASLDAAPRQVDAAFAELVAAGRFKKRSASFYTPDSPANPKPGCYYLRHVGFLGAAPPAVKGLKEVELAEGEEGVVELAEDLEARGVLSRMLRRLRDHLIGTAGQEAADRVLPAWECEELEDLAKRPAEAAAPQPSYSEEVDDMTKQELEAKQAELAARSAALTAQEAKFAEREAALTAADAAAHRAGIAAFLAGLKAKGQLPPAWEKAGLAAFLEGLPHADVVAFAEGDAGKKTPLAFMQDFLAGLPQVVDLGEVATPETAPPAGTGAAGAAAKLDLLAREKRAKDASLSYTEALDQAQREHPDLAKAYLDEIRG